MMNTVFIYNIRGYKAIVWLFNNLVKEGSFGVDRNNKSVQVII